MGNVGLCDFCDSVRWSLVYVSDFVWEGLTWWAVLCGCCDTFHCAMLDVPVERVNRHPRACVWLCSGVSMTAYLNYVVAL